MTWKQLSQLLAFVSKFPTLLYYKMMGITPLVFSTLKGRNSNSSTKLRSFFEVTKFHKYVLQHKLSLIEIRGIKITHC